MRHSFLQLPFLNFASSEPLLILLPYLGRQFLNVPLEAEASGQAGRWRLRTPAAHRSAPDAELDHVGDPQQYGSGLALVWSGPPLDPGSVVSIPVEWPVRIQRAGVRLRARPFLRALVHEALDHVNVIHRAALGAVDRPFPVPEAVWIQVVDSVALFATNFLLAPDYITHAATSSYSQALSYHSLIVVSG